MLFSLFPICGEVQDCFLHNSKLSFLLWDFWIDGLCVNSADQYQPPPSSSSSSCMSEFYVVIQAVSQDVFSMIYADTNSCRNISRETTWNRCLLMERNVAHYMFVCVRESLTCVKSTDENMNHASRESSAPSWKPIIHSKASRESSKMYNMSSVHIGFIYFHVPLVYQVTVGCWRPCPVSPCTPHSLWRWCRPAKACPSLMQGSSISG